MRKILPIILVLVAACGPLPFLENDSYPAPSPENAAWWSGLPPRERAQRILTRAQADAGRYAAESCKEWARTVVIEASRGAANLPATCRYEAGEWHRASHGWYWCPSPYVVNSDVPIQRTEPGQIVQMRRKGSDGAWHPHTAIVLQRTTDGVHWIDSNRFGTETVSEYFESFETFERATCENQKCFYAIYSVTGR